MDAQVEVATKLFRDELEERSMEKVEDSVQGYLGVC